MTKLCGSGSPKKTILGFTSPSHEGQCGTVRARTAECMASLGKAERHSMQLCLEGRQKLVLLLLISLHDDDDDDDDDDDNDFFNAASIFSLA